MIIYDRDDKTLVIPNGLGNMINNYDEGYADGFTEGYNEGQESVLENNNN